MAVLVHGMMSESRCWWSVAPAIAARGYRVLAADLPGHGRSPGRADADMEMFVEALLASVPPRPELVVAHSMGAFVVAAALDRLAPERVVFVDTPFGPSRPVPDPAALSAGYAKARSRRTRERLEQDVPWWHPTDRTVEAEAAEAFDVATSVALLTSAAGKDYTPAVRVPTLMVRAEPSRNVPEQLARDLRIRGWVVRSIAGADHSVWYGKENAFLDALEDWL